MAKKRKTQEVDASSIADIAFLLLAFIIIATTLEKEEGIPAVLPQKRDINQPIPPKIKKRNLLEILVNKSDQLMIEGQWDKDIDDIKPIVMDFMKNTSDNPDLAVMVTIDMATCNSQIALLQKLVDEGDNTVETKLKKWKNKKEAVKRVGPYQTVTKSATIAIQYDKGTTYGTYLEVRDEIMSGVNQLRNDLSIEKFGISYNELESIREEVKTEEDNARIKAIREVYPQKIIKLPPRNV